LCRIVASRTCISISPSSFWVPHLDNLAMEAIAARACLIAEMPLRPTCRQLLNQFARLIGPMWHRSEVPDFTAPFALCNRH
jgi:hypothetical protein